MDITCVNSGYSAMQPSFDNSFTNIGGMGSTYEAYPQCGGGKGSGKGKKAKKAKKGKKGKKTTLRKPISKRVKQLSKMRMRNVKKISQRAKKLSKRLKNRASRKNVINSLASRKPITPKTLNSLSPSMKRFVSKIPKDASSSSKLTSWPDVSFTSTSTNKVGKKTFEDARKGLANLLKQKPVYGKSKSTVKFSDYKSKPSKEKAALKASKKKKGQTR